MPSARLGRARHPGVRQLQRRFVITNTVALNGGDATILHAIVVLLRKRFGNDTTIDAFDANPEVAARHYAHIAFHPHVALADRKSKKPRGRFPRSLHRARMLIAAASPGGLAVRWIAPTHVQEAIDLYRKADVIVSTGGTYLAEQYDLWGRFLDFELVRVLGKPLVLYTQSITYFSNEGTRSQMARVLEQAKLVLLRGSESFTNVRRILGRELSTWHVQPDVVFALAMPERLQAAGTRIWPKESPKVLISVRSWSRFKDRTVEDGNRHYFESIRALVHALVRNHGARVTFVSTCQGIPEYSLNDSVVAHAIEQGLDEDVRGQVTVNDAYNSPEKLLELAGEADLVVSTRLHMAIIALVAGTPVLPISYEHKTQEVFGQLGQGAYVLDIADLTAAESLTMLGEFLEWLPGNRAQVFNAVDALRNEATKSMDMVAQLLEAEPRSS